jgi:hypothetical protein
MPNPVVHTTEFQFNLPAGGLATLDVFDVTGRLVANVLDRTLDAGSHSVNWNPASDLAAGAYFYRLEANGRPVMGKVTLVRYALDLGGVNRARPASRSRSGGEATGPLPSFPFRKRARRTEHEELRQWFVSVRTASSHDIVGLWSFPSFSPVLSRLHRRVRPIPAFRERS